MAAGASAIHRNAKCLPNTPEMRRDVRKCDRLVTGSCGSRDEDWARGEGGIPMDAIDRNSRRMVALFEELEKREGARESLLYGVKLMRVGCAVRRIPVMYEPCIVIVAQGRKRGFLGDQRFVYDARHYLTLTVPLPFECETE